jgi:hypothetical protein
MDVILLHSDHLFIHAFIHIQSAFVGLLKNIVYLINIHKNGTYKTAKCTFRIDCRFFNKCKHEFRSVFNHQLALPFRFTLKATGFQMLTYVKVLQNTKRCRNVAEWMFVAFINLFLIVR